MKKDTLITATGRDPGLPISPGGFLQDRYEIAVGTKSGGRSVTPGHCKGSSQCRKTNLATEGTPAVSNTKSM